MLITLTVILAVLWLLGIAFSFTLGGIIHLLLPLAIITLVYHFIATSATGEEVKYAPTLY